MNADELRARQAPIKDRYQSDPAAALVTMSVTGELDQPSLCCRLPPRDTDKSKLHRAAGGTEPSLCSGDLLLESLAACAGVTLCTVATALGIAVSRGTVTASGEIDFRGTLGVSRDAPVGMQNLSVHFELTTDADETRLEKLRQLTERYCVIHQTLARENPIPISIANAN